MHGCARKKLRQMLKSGELWDGKTQITLALYVNWACGQCANHLGRDACTEAVPERSRNGLETVPERVRRCDHWHGLAQVAQGLNCVAGAAFWQGRVQISWQAQHFRKVKRGTDAQGGACRFRGRGSRFCKVRYRFRGRRNTFVIEGTITFFQLQLENHKKFSTKVVFEVHFSSCSSLSTKVVFEVDILMKRAR